MSLDLDGTIKAALAELGETFADVGSRLIELDCKGSHEGYDCPVFHYLADVKEIRGIERVILTEVWLNDSPLDEPGTEPAARVPLPSAVAEFVNAFDDGDFPMLEVGR